VKHAVTVLQSCSRRESVSSNRYAIDEGVRFNEERVMKSRVINDFRARGPWPPRAFLWLSRSGVAVGGALCVMALSGCYYPYGYYPSGYYPAYYSTVPATAVQQDAPVGQSGSADPQQQQAQMAQQVPPPTYPVAAPPVYVAPAYPAYYPPPVYPAYPAWYGYPGYYGPSVSIGIGGYWGGGGWGHHHWH
jgi:hypothetical protein